jgi:hypothetical protein
MTPHRATHQRKEITMPEMHRRTIAAAAFSVAGCLLFAGCGNGSPAASSSTPAVPAKSGAVSDAPTDPARTEAATEPTVSSGSAHACGLVTQKEAGTALGKDPGPGSKFSSHGSSQCQYGDYATGLVLVNLTPRRGKAAYDLMHNNPKLGHAVDAEGLGDRAFEISGPNTASIYFDKGDALVLVMVEIRSSTTPPMGQARTLAKSAADRV